MTQPPPSPPGSPPPSGPVDPGQAVSLPATLLTVLGALYIAFSIIGGLLTILGIGIGAAGGEGMGSMAFSGVRGAISLIFGIALGGIILFGSLKMKKLQNYNLAMASAIAAMLPCTCCCVAGLPLGIWALVVLLKPEVKAAFVG